MSAQQVGIRVKFERLSALPFATSIQIARSIDQRTGTCQITLERVQVTDTRDVADLIQRGDTVAVDAALVSIGSSDLLPEFRGFVTQIITEDDRVTVLCEDQMWQLKQKHVEVNLTGAALPDLIALLHDGPAEVEPIRLGDFRAESQNVSAAKILEVIRERFGVRSFFRLGTDGVQTLIAGGEYSTRRRALIKMWLHVPESGNNLEPRRASQTKVRVDAQNVSLDGTVEEDSFGDVDADPVDVIQRSYVETPDWQKLAKKVVSEHKFDGFTGSFVAHPTARIQQGEIVELQDPRFPERDGAYFVRSVQTTIDTSDFIRQIELGRRV